MTQKRRRKSRVSLGREGSPEKARTSTGMARLLNQLAAHRAGKRTRVAVPQVDPFVSNPNTQSSIKTVANPKMWRKKVDGSDIFPTPREKKAA